jgi:hypothetical protein
MTRPAARVVLCAALLVTWIGVLGVPPAGAVTVGYVRLAHLSPDTPKVDVYVTSFAGFSKTFRGVGYGDVSPYQRLATGTYTVSMRMAGASDSSPPVISTTVMVAAGHAYTVAGVGKQSSLELRVLNDRLSQPPPGTASVRVVQASLNEPNIDLMTASGMTIVKGATFPSTTKYLDVPAQRWTLQVRPHGSTDVVASKTIRLRSGQIDSVLVLDTEGSSSGVMLTVQPDAVGSTAMPAGGVAAGLGGAAVSHAGDGGGSGSTRALVAVVAMSLVVAAGGIAGRALRR